MENNTCQTEKHDQLENKLINIINHDVKSPLENFAYFISVSKDKPLAEQDYRSFMETLESFLLSSNALLDNLIGWNKVKISSANFNEETFYADALADRITASLDYMLVNKSVKIYSLIPENSLCRCNLQVFEFVLKTLLRSSIKYSHQQNIITVTYVSLNGILKLKVSNTLNIINNVALKMALEQAEVLPGAANDISFLLCKQCLAIYDGSMEVNSSLERGTTFSFALPNTIKNKLIY